MIIISYSNPGLILDGILIQLSHPRNVRASVFLGWQVATLRFGRVEIDSSGSWKLLKLGSTWIATDLGEFWSLQFIVFYVQLVCLSAGSDPPPSLQSFSASGELQTIYIYCILYIEVYNRPYEFTIVYPSHHVPSQFQTFSGLVLSIRQLNRVSVSILIQHVLYNHIKNHIHSYSCHWSSL